MNKILEKQLAEVFEQDYQGYDNFVENVINRVFTGDDTFEALPVPEDILDDTNRNAATNAGILQILKIGSIDAIEGIDVYDITLRDNKQLQYNRVGIQQLIRSQQIFYSNAFLLFHNEHPEGKEWRFSFFYKQGKNKDTTSAKRFTYLFGKNLRARTASERFALLAEMEKDTDNLLEAFSVEVLTKQFYQDLFEWYQWAVKPETGITFPNNTSIEDDDREDIDIKIIRLITRLMFVWFIKQKGLVPSRIFDTSFLSTILKNFEALSATKGTFYNAILQNLFFATLNRAIVDEDGNQRKFAKSSKRDIKTLYRYAELFCISEEEVIKLFAEVPFLNGGLFECLDKTRYIDGVEVAYNFDGFSRNDLKFADGRYKHRAIVPNILFFEPEKGLISILSRYNFTIEENSPEELQVALDPELLGKVFENLLGAYNPETKETAHNQSGSFYTPREIVNYMVD